MFSGIKGIVGFWILSGIDIGPGLALMLGEEMLGSKMQDPVFLEYSKTILP